MFFVTQQWTNRPPGSRERFTTHWIVSWFELVLKQLSVRRVEASQSFELMHYFKFKRSFEFFFRHSCLEYNFHHNYYPNGKGKYKFRKGLGWDFIPHFDIFRLANCLWNLWVKKLVNEPLKAFLFIRLINHTPLSLNAPKYQEERTTISISPPPLLRQHKHKHPKVHTILCRYADVVTLILKRLTLSFLNVWREKISVHTWTRKSECQTTKHT